MTTTFRITGAATLLAGTLLLASCGARTVEVTARAKPPETGASTTLDDSVSTSSTPDEPTTTVGRPPATTTRSPRTTDAPSPSTGPERSNEAFCAAAGDIVDSGLTGLQSLNLRNPPTGAEGMAKFKEWMHTVDGIMARMDATAPPAIAADMHTVALATHKSVQAMSSATGPRQMLGSGDIMGDSASAAASARVVQYTLEHCGFSLQGHATN